MASPRRRRLRKMLRAGLLKAANAAEAAAEAVAPAPVEPPAPLVDAPVVEEAAEEAPKKAAPKKAPAQKATDITVLFSRAEDFLKKNPTQDNLAKVLKKYEGEFSLEQAAMLGDIVNKK